MRLRRIDTRYLAAEDRIRLLGVTTDNQTLVLWLTRRLLDRLLAQVLEQFDLYHGGGPPADGPAPQGPHWPGETGSVPEPVMSPTPEAPPLRAAPPWLVSRVTLREMPPGLWCGFQGQAPEQRATLVFTPWQLRHWLRILLGEYRRAQWPLGAWRAWLTPKAKASGRTHSRLH